jgi:hypothetical protein
MSLLIQTAAPSGPDSRHGAKNQRFFRIRWKKAAILLRPGPVPLLLPASMKNHFLLQFDRFGGKAAPSFYHTRSRGRSQQKMSDFGHRKSLPQVQMKGMRQFKELPHTTIFHSIIFS